MPEVVSISSIPARSRYEAIVSTGSLETLGDWAAGCLRGGKRRIAILTNRTVARLYLDQVQGSLERAGIKALPFILPDGERYKNLKSLSQFLDFLGQHEVTRTDAIASLGGGVIGDIAGFASAIYLRGISFLQVPTTLLSMIDSSVGGKVGINTQFGKNLLGAFHQPTGVFIDPAVLKTLPRREMTAGFCEAVKQAALAGGKLFDITNEMIGRCAADGLQCIFSTTRNAEMFERFIAGQIRFKASIVRGDERERAENSSPRSRKILNFGHTFAHALEKATDYRYLRHGEAVGHGILFALDLSKRLELLDNHSVKLLNDVVHRCGPLPPISNIAPDLIRQALKHDKKNVNGTLQWILLEAIGRPRIVPGTDIPSTVLTTTIKAALRK